MLYIKQAGVAKFIQQKKSTIQKSYNYKSNHDFFFYFLAFFF